jgi:hypothetical protein
MNLGHIFGLTAASNFVPWIRVLNSRAVINWALIRRFIIEDDMDQSPSQEVLKQARNAEIATVLGKKPTLSPFAVAITVLSLRFSNNHPMIGEGQPDKIFTLIDHALTACHSHSAGCAENCNLPWPIFVQNRLKQLSITNSLILCEDPLINKPTASDLIRPTEGFVFKSGAAVHNIGQPFEDFSIWALALRLQCLLEQSS